MSDEPIPFQDAEGRKLAAVSMFAATSLPDQVAVVRLALGQSTVHVCVEPVDDTLEIWIEPAGPCVEGMGVELSSTFWLPLIGWTLTSAWSMRNQRGYVDGLMLEFRQEPADTEARMVHLLAIASCIRISELVEARHS